MSVSALRDRDLRLRDTHELALREVDGERDAADVRRESVLHLQALVALVVQVEEGPRKARRADLSEQKTLKST